MVSFSFLLTCIILHTVFLLEILSILCLQPNAQCIYNVYIYFVSWLGVCVKLRSRSLRHDAVAPFPHIPLATPSCPLPLTSSPEALALYLWPMRRQSLMFLLLETTLLSLGKAFWFQNTRKMVPIEKKEKLFSNILLSLP